MMKINEDDEFNKNQQKNCKFNRNGKKFVKIKIISSVKIYKLTKSIILVKSVIYEVNKVSSIVIRDTSTFFFFLKTYKTHKKYTLKTKAITIFCYFSLLLLAFSYLNLLFFTL